MSLGEGIEELAESWIDEPVLDPEDSDASYPISASQIKKYRNCPESYRFRYLTDKEPTKASKGYLELGSGVHEAIENVLEEEPPLNKSRLTRDFKREYRQLGDDIPDDMYDDGLSYLTVAARYLSKTRPDIWDIEKDVTYGLKRADINAQVRGIMDVAYDGGILDWKTGRIRDDTPVEEQIQGAVYMMSYHREYGHPPDEVNFVYLKEEKVRSLEPSDENWQTMLRHARTLIRGKQNNNYEADPGSACYFCGHESRCSASKVGVGGVDWNKF